MNDDLDIPSIDLYTEPFKRLFRDGHDKRSSPEAVQMMQEEVERYAMLIASRAAELSEHANRETIKPEDMDTALNQVTREKGHANQR